MKKSIFIALLAVLFSLSSNAQSNLKRYMMKL